LRHILDLGATSLLAKQNITKSPQMYHRNAVYRESFERGLITDQENHLIYPGSDLIKNWTYPWYSMPGVHVLCSNELEFTNFGVPGVYF